MVFGSLYSADFVAAARAGLTGLHRELGEPALCQEGWNPQAVEGAGITSSGLQIGSGLVDFAPAIVEDFLHPTILTLFGATLGEDFAIDVIGGCVSDETRARKPWHHHCGGPDEERSDPAFAPVGEPAMRLNLLIYLDDVGEGGGQLLVQPRSIDTPIELCGDERADWDSQVVLGWTAGTAVVLDERTWHGVWPQTRPGHRMFVGGYFRAPALPAPRNADAGAARLRSRMMR